MLSRSTALEFFDVLTVLSCWWLGLSDCFFEEAFRREDFKLDLIDFMVSRLLVLKFARTRARSSKRTAKERTHINCSIFV